MADVLFDQTRPEHLGPDPSELGTGIFMLEDPARKVGLTKLLVPNATYSHAQQIAGADKQVRYFRWVPHRILSYAKICGG